ncbi:hypothetical protein JCM10449v2_007933 [Rhodotorula kratochvilovae]
MGQAESHPQADGASSPANAPSSTLAFHVLRVAENSPAAEAGVEPFFDFIVGAAGRQLGDDLDLLTDVLEENEGGEVALQIYSTKRKEVREVYVIPSRTWSSSAVGGGTTSGSVDGQPSLLGLSLRLCNPHHALDQVWHVLEILEGSPAQSAGLVPFGDWIIGYAGGVLRGEGDFYDVVEAHVDKPLRLFVYNTDYDVTREAILVPNRTWGGEGLLGCGVGYGLLHRIPKPQDRARAAPQPYDTPYDTPYAAPPPPQPVQRQQQQQQITSPPKTDRLTSFSSTSGTMQNPLYAPPPPRNPAAPPPPRTSISATPPRASATPPRAPAPAPAPARRTAALASYDERDESADPYGAHAGHSYGHDDSHDGGYALDGSVEYGTAGEDPYAQPSFVHYGSAAYDASEGVEVVPVQEGDDEEQEDFVRAPQPRGGYGGYANGRV